VDSGGSISPGGRRLARVYSGPSQIPLHHSSKIQWEFYTGTLAYDEVTAQKMKVRFLTCQTAFLFLMLVIILDEGDSFLLHN
jgi:hypothetical protein